jgi:hypothetical protein
LNWLGIRALQVLGLAHGIKRVRFDRASSAWELVRSHVARDQVVRSQS